MDLNTPVISLKKFMTLKEESKDKTKPLISSAILVAIDIDSVMAFSDCCFNGVISSNGLVICSKCNSEVKL